MLWHGNAEYKMPTEEKANKNTQTVLNTDMFLGTSTIM